MINKEIISIASKTSNVGLNNKYSHKITIKNNLCGDKITLELTVRKKKNSINEICDRVLYILRSFSKPFIEKN